jgi:hypothetical protein
MIDEERQRSNFSCTETVRAAFRLSFLNIFYVFVTVTGNFLSCAAKERSVTVRTTVKMCTPVERTLCRCSLSLFNVALAMTLVCHKLFTTKDLQFLQCF